MEKKFDVASDRIYDEFEPIARWTSEPGFETLTVYLPGFRKEQLKVQVTSTRKLRVMGERPAGGNKWIRFLKEFPIQSDVDADAIAAKFEGVNLVVKLPRPEPKGKQFPSGDGAAKQPIQQIPKPAEKEEASEGAEKAIQERSKPLMGKPGRKEEASRRAEKVHPEKPAMEKLSEKEGETEKRAEKEEVPRDAEKTKEKEKRNDGFQGPCCKVGGYKNVIRGYLREMKNNKRAMSVGLVVVASMVVFSLGIYTGKRLG